MRASAFSSSPDQVDHLVERPGTPVATAVELDHLADGELGLDARGLQHDADAVAEVTPGAGGVDPQHLDGARRGGSVPLEDLDGGRLAGAVRSEQGVHLAGLDLEAQPVDRGHGTVGLAQARRHVDGAAISDVIGSPVSLRRCSAAGTK